MKDKRNTFSVHVDTNKLQTAGEPVRLSDDVTHPDLAFQYFLAHRKDDVNTYLLFCDCARVFLMLLL